MALGPIEILVIEFPGNQFTGAIIPELERLIANDTISVIDGLLVRKDSAREQRHGRQRGDDLQNQYITCAATNESLRTRPPSRRLCCTDPLKMMLRVSE